MKQDNSIRGLYDRLHKISNRKLYNFAINDESEYKNKLWHHLECLNLSTAEMYDLMVDFKLYAVGILRYRQLKVKDVKRYFTHSKDEGDNLIHI